MGRHELAKEPAKVQRSRLRSSPRRRVLRHRRRCQYAAAAPMPTRFSATRPVVCRSCRLHHWLFSSQISGGEIRTRPCCQPVRFGIGWRIVSQYLPKGGTRAGSLGQDRYASPQFPRKFAKSAAFGQCAGHPNGLLDVMVPNPGTPRARARQRDRRFRTENATRFGARCDLTWRLLRPTAPADSRGQPLTHIHMRPWAAGSTGEELYIR